MQKDNNPTILMKPDLADIGIKVSDSSLRRWEVEGRFPRRIHMAGTRVAWLKSEIDEWVLSCSAGRETYFYGDLK